MLADLRNDCRHPGAAPEDRGSSHPGREAFDSDANHSPSRAERPSGALGSIAGSGSSCASSGLDGQVLVEYGQSRSTGEESDRGESPQLPWQLPDDPKDPNRAQQPHEVRGARFPLPEPALGVDASAASTKRAFVLLRYLDVVLVVIAMAPALALGVPVARLCRCCLRLDPAARDRRNRSALDSQGKRAATAARRQPVRGFRADLAAGRRDHRRGRRRRPRGRTHRGTGDLRGVLGGLRDQGDHGTTAAEGAPMSLAPTTPRLDHEQGQEAQCRREGQEAHEPPQEDRLRHRSPRTSSDWSCSSLVFGVHEHQNTQFNIVSPYHLVTWVHLVGPLNLNKGVLYLLMTAALTIGILVWVARRMQMRPNRVQTAVEWALRPVEATDPRQHGRADGQEVVSARIHPVRVRPRHQPPRVHPVAGQHRRQDQCGWGALPVVPDLCGGHQRGASAGTGVRRIHRLQRRGHPCTTGSAGT